MTEKVRSIHITSARREIAFQERRIETAVTDYQRKGAEYLLNREKMRLEMLETGR